jgi:hypothetical protein
MPPNTPSDLADVLEDACFDLAETAAGSALIGAGPSDWWDLHEPDHGHLVGRAVVTLEDGIDVYAFTGGDAALLAWQVHLSSSTPTAVVEKVLEGVFAAASAALS